MRISYNKLQKLMIDNQMKRQDLMRAAEISSSVATKLNKNETVSLGFNGKVQILAPESVKEQYRQMIAKADEDMQESE